MIPKTLTIGTKTKEQLLADLEKDGHKISDWAKESVGKIEFSTTPQELQLADMTASELGIGEYPTTAQVQERIEALGYGLVPQETALYLRLAYGDQPPGEWLACFSKPVADAVGYLNVLRVERDSDGSWVSWSDAYPYDVWRGECRLVFCRTASPPLEPSVLSDPCGLPAELVINGQAYVKKEDRHE